MAVRGARRRRGYERGFNPSSDHADWNGLQLRRRCAIQAARQVYVTHGNSERPGPLILTRKEGDQMRNPWQGALKRKRLSEERV